MFKYRLAPAVSGALLAAVFSVACAAATSQPATSPAPPAAQAGSGAAGAPAVPVRYAKSPDGTRLAYDVTGSGPAILLLHGAGETRAAWHETGYVKDLAEQFTVIAMDLRGHGASDKPTRPEAYAVDRLVEDVLAVADAAGADAFHLWGFAHGAIVGRYAANTSPRVRSMIYIGVPFGDAATGEVRMGLEGMVKRWRPVLDQHNAGTLQLESMPPSDRESWMRGALPVSVAAFAALLEYPKVEPADMKVPTLWIVGGGDPEAMESVKAYRDTLEGTPVTLTVMDGLNHGETMFKISDMLPKEKAFTAAQAAKATTAR